MSYTITRTVARPRLGLDIDGCLYDWFGAYRFLANHYLHVDLPPVDKIWDGKHTDVDFLTGDQLEWMWTEGVKRGLFRYGHVIKGAVEAMRVLADVAKLVIVTHRPTSWVINVSEESRRIGVTDTLDWLAFLRLPLDEVHILPKDQPKSSVPCDLYLDDGLHVIEDLLGNRPESTIMLRDRPWNQVPIAVPEGSDFHRVGTWDEVIGHTKRRGRAPYPEVGPYGGIGMRDERA